MKRHDVLNFLGVWRCVGYALALVATALALASLLMAPALGLPHHVFVPSLTLAVTGGLVLAWTAALSQRLVRRMHFETTEETR